MRESCSQGWPSLFPFLKIAHHSSHLVKNHFLTSVRSGRAANEFRLAHLLRMLSPHTDSTITQMMNAQQQSGSPPLF